LSKQILVIEDAEAQRDLIRIALRPSGFAVTEAVNGREGIAYLERADYAAIILDLRMPGENGEVVIEWIIANRSHLRSRVLVVSGMLSPADELFLAQARMPVLTKPYLIKDLVQIVTKLAASG
jgi:CheY-like chemotaxis protein